MDHDPQPVNILSRRNYKRIEMSLLGKRQYDTGSSLQTVMASFQGIHPVNQYALTANSAIPLADAIRGYHDELGLPEPAIGYVRANSTLARTKSQPKLEDEILMDALRIHENVRGKTIGLIDQYRATGRTLRIGKKILTVAGAKGVRYFDDTRWYDQAIEHEVDKESMTSEHAEFMREIGAKAAQMLAYF